jgi:cytochrome d ubiquinol oxidase subunit I
MDAVTAHRIHFAFTATYHYLFPQLTMGLSLIIVILKSAALRTADAHYDRAARFWGRILAINFAMGVVTGIPLEFQFGTNWSRFSREAGGVIGQPLAMEGVFAFFLESTFLGLFLFGEQRLGRWGHWVAAALVFVGSWVSGYFIIATNAWMQHPVGYTRGADGAFGLVSLGELLLNPWGLRQYAHTMTAAVITACFVVASIGAYYLIVGEHTAYGRTFVRVGVIVGVVATWGQTFPTGDAQGRMVALHQPVTLAAMEGLFHTEEGAPIAILGQPDVANRRLDNPLLVPRVLSFLTYRRWMARVQGLDSFPEETWPDNIPLLYYSYHIMVGLGTIFVAIMTIAAWQLWRGSLFRSPAMLWVLMLALPFPYIANIAGWSTAELGRQPWAIYGLLRTADGSSSLVSAGNALFTLLGFAGMYALLTVLGLFLVSREIVRGPEHETT